MSQSWHHDTHQSKQQCEFTVPSILWWTQEAGQSSQKINTDLHLPVKESQILMKGCQHVLEHRNTFTTFFFFWSMWKGANEEKCEVPDVPNQ